MDPLNRVPDGYYVVLQTARTGDPGPNQEAESKVYALQQDVHNAVRNVVRRTAVDLGRSFGWWIRKDKWPEIRVGIEEIIKTLLVQVNEAAEKLGAQRRFQVGVYPADLVGREPYDAMLLEFAWALENFRISLPQITKLQTVQYKISRELKNIRDALPPLIAGQWDAALNEVKENYAELQDALRRPIPKGLDREFAAKIHKSPPLAYAELLEWPKCDVVIRALRVEASRGAPTAPAVIPSSGRLRDLFPTTDIPRHRKTK